MSPEVFSDCLANCMCVFLTERNTYTVFSNIGKGGL